ncbi:MAG: PAS-domain containing protein [Paracoccus sp. (in: a-proteobacteria)]|uniref:PAS-domain containing protein n=1 Tax=Paracoccus sp. TaxID=267 RepID=UPI0026DF49E9|nr:PAS-domain containing protein [Paracoccus sp. (in: a-proteobacteria)]MDO5621004.1 PAS-domain containing protein [Paracoccus sp. (in: a-proteobacteria)]
MLTVVIAGTISVVIALGLFRALDGRKAGPASAGLTGALQPMVFLFQNNKLVDATAPAHALLAELPGTSERARLTAWLAMQFPYLDHGFPRPESGHRLALTSDGNSPVHLLVEDMGDDHLRLTITAPGREGVGQIVDPLAQTALLQEVELLRRAVDTAPILAWQQDAQGAITWANAAYIALAEQQTGQPTLWPLPRLFQVNPAQMQDGQTSRLMLEGAKGQNWFDCNASTQQGGTLFCALPADETVRAERSLREFVQTLTKTFADLPIGLAIFDRDRRMQLFNPALIDLFGLPTGFMISRPTLYAVLDRLREARMIPEPKDYRTWQRQIANLETGAAAGHYVETWSLPGGQTYRVTGRPHPDGAIAFLFEDISSETMMTRRFRSELSHGTQLLDSLDDALALFSLDGSMVMSNRAYRELWSKEPESIRFALGRWQASSADPSEARALSDALTTEAAAPQVNGRLQLREGPVLNWRVAPAGRGRRMVSFGQSQPGQMTPPLTGFGPASHGLLPQERADKAPQAANQPTEHPVLHAAAE